jgi:hypothetical protein
MAHPFWIWQVAKYTAERPTEQRETQKRPAQRPTRGPRETQSRRLSRPIVVIARTIGVLTLLLVGGSQPTTGHAQSGPNDWPRFNGRDLGGWRVVDRHFFGQHGRVQWREGAMVLDAGKPGTAIAWSGATPRQNYELRCEAKRLDGDDFFFGLTFPVDKSHCTLILGGWGGGTTGLSNIDDYSAVENETTDYIPFENGRWYRIRLRVEPQRIQAWVDDKRIVDVMTADKRFSIWWEQEPVRPIGIATWNTRAALRNLQVTRFPEPPSPPSPSLPPSPPQPPPTSPTSPKNPPTSGAEDRRNAAAEGEFFERRIRPVLAERCYGCHSSKSAAVKGGLRLDSRASILRGGDSGPALDLAQPAASLLLEAIRYSGSVSVMPPDGKLPATVIADFERWIARGAVFPGPGAGPDSNATPAPNAASNKDGDKDGDSASDSASDNSAPRKVNLAAGRKFWSFQPLAPQTLPQRHSRVAPPATPEAPATGRDKPPTSVNSAASTTSAGTAMAERTVRNRIDVFVQDALFDHGMTPAPEAAPRTLIRRLSFDLRGLPPTPEEVDAVADDSAAGDSAAADSAAADSAAADNAAAPDHYQRWLDRYMASPQYGERWGRHWLDVARYAEDHPTSESTCVAPRFPFRYRDWVIRAWNEDVPYDEQVRRQLAADLMDLRTSAPEQLAALGFLGLSPVYHKEPKLAADVIATIVADEWDERLDTVTRGFLGLTVACARCHDHKFDPLRTEDYYALAGVMASTQVVEWPLEAAPREAAEALTEVQRQIVDTQLRLDYAKKHRDTAKREGQDTAAHEAAVAAVEAEMKRLKSIPLYSGPIANAVRDASLWLNGDDPSWTYLDYRAGEPRDLPVFIRGNANRHGAKVPRRFLEVLTPPTGPTPFPGNTSGRRELAEAMVTQAGPLAARVIVNRVWAWHFGEGLVRTPSNFGQLGERPTHPELLEDLAARFVAQGWSLKWLHREILSSHTWRQEAIARPRDPDNRWLAGMSRRRLDPEAWRDAVLSLSEQLDHTQFGPSSKLDDPNFRRRTIYGTISRQKPSSLLKLFDFPDAKQHSERRVATTTPLQHLYLLNSDFLHAASTRLAAQCLAAVANDDREEARVDWLFHRVLLRPPTATERADALALVATPAAASPPIAESQSPNGSEKNAETSRWALLAHALLATNEFLHVD